MSDLVFSGVQPSAASVHIGNYLGAMKWFVKLQEQFPLMVCVVDFHALTSVDKRGELRSFSQSLAATYLALGLTKDSTILFRQSDIPEVCELTWYLACQFPLGLLERATAFKDKREKQEQVNSGLLFYPILMAADILLYKATKVPVGADQKQHIEMTREVSEKFNYRFGTTFPQPEPLIDKKTGIIPGLDGRKMSKSYDNFIGLFETEKVIESKVKKIVTDSKGVDESKDPETCNVFSLYNHFATEDEISELRESYLKGGLGYGTAKMELFRVIMRELSPIREKYTYYMSRPREVETILEQGAEKARIIALKTMKEVKEAIGI